MRQPEAVAMSGFTIGMTFAALVDAVVRVVP